MTALGRVGRTTAGQSAGNPGEQTTAPADGHTGEGESGAPKENSGNEASAASSGAQRFPCPPRNLKRKTKVYHSGAKYD